MTDAAQLEMFPAADGSPVESEPVPRRGRMTWQQRAQGGEPGCGPKGRKCNDCAHAHRLKAGSKTFYKCLQNEANWTHGTKTDIRLRWPACSLWEPIPNFGLAFVYVKERDIHPGFLERVGLELRMWTPNGHVYFVGDDPESEAIAWLRANTKPLA